MAAPITKKEIQKLPIQRYDTICDDIQTGDLFFCSGFYFFSHAIQKFTRSVWSHVGMIYKDPTLQRVFILESETLIGVPFNLHDDYVSPDDIWLDDQVQLRYRIM
jgi:hypothetical protein